MNNHYARRLGVLTTMALFGLAVLAGPAFAAGDPDPRPPPSDTKNPDQKNSQKKKKPGKSSEQQFIDGYHAARALVLDGRYEEGIAAFKALGHDDSAEVANYIGYASRKLGDYQAAKVWYERALAADPHHLRTWQYYGMWHVEQGNMLKAAEFLETIQLICGTVTCREYQDLKGAMEGKISY